VQAERKLERLRSLQLFVLDNSVRESTVAQLRGHTLADKHALIRLVRDAGIRHQIVACFAAQRRVDDQLARQLQSDASVATEYAQQTFYVFAELHERDPASPLAINDAPSVGLLRAREYGICNLVLEMDCRCVVLGDAPEHVPRVTAFIATRLVWVRRHLGEHARVFINLRDFVPANELPSTLEGVTRWLAALPDHQRCAGLLFEDPAGGVFPATLGAYVAATRAIMDEAGWEDGHLLVHVHQGFGLAEACVLESLACGATGIWCGISREGAGVGHANSLTTICNLQRLGNEDAKRRFNLATLRAAAIEATRVCTGEAPHPQTELYGSRALDVCFDPAFGMGGGGGFDTATAMAVQPQIRVSTMTTISMFGDKLTEVFGADAAPGGAGGWPHEVLCVMWANVNRDLLGGVKEEYDSADALLALYERSGGGVSDAMRARMAALALADAHPVVAAFRAGFAAAFGADAQQCDADEFYAAMCARYLASPDSPQYHTLCQLCAFSDGDAATTTAAASVTEAQAGAQETRPASIHLAAAASRFAWAVRCYPAECADLDAAWMCVLQRLVARRLALHNVRRRFRVGLHKGVALLAAMRHAHDAAS
jgi:hypothetical protein